MKIEIDKQVVGEEVEIMIINDDHVKSKKRGKVNLINFVFFNEKDFFLLITQ